MLFLLVLFALLFEPCNGFLIGVDENLACVAVNSGKNSAFYGIEKLRSNAYDRRDIHISCKDSRVRIGRAESRYECEDFVLVELNGFARCEVVSADYHLFIGNGVRTALVRKTAYDTVGNVLDISRTSLHICIVH